jgi:nucleoside-diphosphate-sugar epimerase
MKVLVTGGGGYIGSVLVPELLASGHAVTVLDTFPGGGTELAACCRSKNFEPIRADARDERVLKELVPKADVLIPLAALVGAPLCKQDPISATTLNRDAVLSLLRLTSAQQKVIYPTTNSGYGIGISGQHCTETTPLNPISLYGTTKVEAEQAVLDKGNDFTWRAVTDRTVVIFEGHFKRNYIHVRDVAHTFQHALANFASMRGQPYNVGLATANLSKLELCQRIKEKVPGFVFLEAPIGEDPDKRDYIVSNEKLEATGWKPRVTLEDGIDELVKGYKMLRNSRYANV